MTHNKIDNDGVSLAVSVTGDGPDVLFVHGLGSAQVLWEPFIATLADRYRCWNLDLRGHGGSDWVPDGYSPASYGSDVAAALDHIGRPTLAVGHSLGGGSIIQVAIAAHAHLRGVFILDSRMVSMPSAPSPSRRLFKRQLAMVRTFQSEDRPVDDYEAVLADAPNPVGGTNRDTMWPNQLRGRAESLSQMDPECMQLAVDRQPPPPDAPNFAPAVTVPMRVLAADPNLGASVRPEHHELLQAATPHVEIDTVMGVGHQLMMMRGFDEPILADLERWLGATSAGTDE